MLVTLLGLALIVVVALFVAWPIATGTRSTASDEARSAAGTEAAARRREKEEALAAIKEAELDHEVGKLSDEDYRAFRNELEMRAMQAMAALDAVSAASAGAAPLPVDGSAPAPVQAKDARSRRPAAQPSAEPGPFCAGCGRQSTIGAAFCAGCGAKLPAARGAGRRRA
jgi:hypothetical protein